MLCKMIGCLLCWCEAMPLQFFCISKVFPYIDFFFHFSWLCLGICLLTVTVYIWDFIFMSFLVITDLLSLYNCKYSILNTYFPIDLV
jgi:hypothetical protein